jgi:hypothetical protein
MIVHTNLDSELEAKVRPELLDARDHDRLKTRKVGWRSRVLFAGLGVLALAHDRMMQAIPQRLGKLIDLIIAIDLDGFFRGVHYHVAFVAPMEMFVQLGFGTLGEGTVEVVGQLLKKLSALHVARLRSFSP